MGSEPNNHTVAVAGIRTAAATIDLYVLRVGLGVTAKIGLEQRLFEDHVRSGIDHVGAVVGVDRVGRTGEEEVGQQHVVLWNRNERRRFR